MGIVNQSEPRAVLAPLDSNDRAKGDAPTLNEVLVNVELSDRALRRIEAEAARRGVSIDVVIGDLAAGSPAVPTGARRRPAFVAAGAVGTRNH